MPVDVEAYMAGAIPSVSRGGSWLPDRQGPHANSISPPYPHSAQSSSFSPFPQTPPAILSGMRVSPTIAQPLQFPRSPWSGHIASPESVHSSRSRTMSHTEVAGAATVNGLRKERNLGPVKHQGWLTSASEGSQPESGSSYQESVLNSSSGIYVTGQPMSQHSLSRHHGTGNLSNADQWEFHSGSPKPIASEPGCHHSAKVQVSSPNNVVPPASSPYRKINVDQEGLPSPYRRLTELIPSGLSSPTTQHSGNHDDTRRPSLNRRHSHSPLHAPQATKHQDEDLHRSAQLNSRLARLSLQGRKCCTPDPQGSPRSATSSCKRTT
ncbi:uncharacterized protein I206_106089 [Kwoniella pini CBS 10737]|uniref:Uncharacterized protein n=1 Tax=Kwoniella pini CBS 10737 TaxID=1296096 RepID=A0A1B9I139_9TREE|nr:uncharacterized protein I206_04913 [Kwoniella pini CBS 10737]OCF49225.1 hypothetical protein I206_04913 [Kwoniella pini CBS 10737]